jgi:hypothetical protein
MVLDGGFLSEDPVHGVGWWLSKSGPGVWCSMVAPYVRTWCVVLDRGFLSVCPIKLRFLLPICNSVDSYPALFPSGHLMLKMRLTEVRCWDMSIFCKVLFVVSMFPLYTVG